MFARELVSQVGPGVTTAILGSMSTTFTAAGTTQATAAAITTVYTMVTTATEGQGVLIPASMGVSDQLTICNGTSVSVYAYPPSGGQLNNGTANVPFMIAPNSSIEFTCLGSDDWIANR